MSLSAIEQELGLKLLKLIFCILNVESSLNIETESLNTGKLSMLKHFQGLQNIKCVFQL